MNSIIHKINHWGYFSEQKIGLFLTSFIIGIILIGIAMIYVAPSFNPQYHGVAMLNHECSIFLLPGLFAYRNYIHDQKILYINKTILFYILACFPYISYRYYISTHTTVEYGLNFYFSKEIIQKNLPVILPI